MRSLYSDCLVGERLAWLPIQRCSSTAVVISAELWSCIVEELHLPGLLVIRPVSSTFEQLADRELGKLTKLRIYCEKEVEEALKLVDPGKRSCS